jgi:hypothetical protein
MHHTLVDRIDPHAASLLPVVAHVGQERFLEHGRLAAGSSWHVRRKCALIMYCSVVVPHHFNADPDVDPDSTYHPDADVCGVCIYTVCNRGKDEIRFCGEHLQ